MNGDGAALFRGKREDGSPRTSGEPSPNRQNYEERRPTGWAEWAKRKNTNTADLLGKIEKNCPFCAHCTWVIVGKTNVFPGINEYFCNRRYGGKRVTVDMTGRVPETCEHFDVRSKYATKQI